MKLTDFGPSIPTIQPYQNGYSVPVGVKAVERTDFEGDDTYTAYEGYLLQVPFLSELELNAAIAALPEGDYSADKQAALEAAVHFEQRAALDVEGTLLDLQQRAADRDAVIADLMSRIAALEAQAA